MEDLLIKGVINEEVCFNVTEWSLKQALVERDCALSRFSSALTNSEVDSSILFLQSAETKIRAIIQSKKSY